MKKKKQFSFDIRIKIFNEVIKWQFTEMIVCSGNIEILWKGKISWYYSDRVEVFSTNFNIDYQCVPEKT